MKASGKKWISGLVVGLAAISAQRAFADNIIFTSQTSDGNPFVSDTEGGYTVVPTAGTWFQGDSYGNPVPSIFAGPIGSPGHSAISVTDGGGNFLFGSIDYSSNNGDSSYTILGKSGATVDYTETGTLPGVSGIFSFSTLRNREKIT